MTKEHRCLTCKTPMPVSESNRSYCGICGKKRRTKRALSYYHNVIKPKRKLCSHICILCETEFVYDRKNTDFMKVCNGCVHRFDERVSNMICIFCGKLLPKKKGKINLRLFCNKDCSTQAWYLLKKLVVQK